MIGLSSDLVMETLSEVMAIKELHIHDEDAFVVGYFDTVSSSLVMMADDGAHCSWIYLHCGHRNVPMVVHCEMATEISMCSLCGVLIIYVCPRLLGMYREGQKVPYHFL